MVLATTVTLLFASAALVDGWMALLYMKRDVVPPTAPPFSHPLRISTTSMTMTPSDDPQVMADPKGTMDRAHVEHLPHVSGEQLPPDHRDFLLARHGTLQLTPLPSSDPRDPLNWPTWKKDIYLGLITFHAMMSTFGAAALVPAFEDLAKEYHRSVPTISYLVSSQVRWLPSLSLL